MAYLMTDDEFPDHEKVDPLTDGAFRLHVSGMHYCARKLTDGRIPAARVPRLTPTFKPKHLAELVAADMWHEDGKGCGTETCPTGDAGEYVVHDYLEWNKPREWWQARRRAETDRKAAYRARVAARKAREARAVDTP